MPRAWQMRVAILGTWLLALAVWPAEAQTLISPGSDWKYNDSGSNLQTAWRAPGYNEASWLSGFAQLGYGDGGESTVLSYGGNSSNRYITYYFRRSFTVADPAAIAGLTLRLIRDDGCVIYLNGAEVLRSNMPSGTVTYSTLASTAISGADESAWQQAPLDPSLLVAGTNVIAVEIHQQSASSSDISFDLELLATAAQTQGPTVSLVSPINHGVSNSASVTFTGTASAAAGLANATLYLGGPPRTVTFSGPSQVADTQIAADQPSAADGSALSLNVDSLNPHAHTLMKFPALVGPSSGQVAPGAIITSAFLRVNCTNSGNVMRLYRLTQDWVEDQATWNQSSNGNAWGAPGADGAASNAGIALNGDCTSTGQRLIDVTSFVQDWSNGAPNYGLVFVDSGTDGIDMDSSESANSPVLEVVYKDDQQAAQTQDLSGNSSFVSFSVNLVLGQSYFWNIRVTDAQGQQNWAPADFDLTVDSSSPDEPVLISPLDGSTGVETPPTLAVSVSNPDGGQMDVAFSARPSSAPEFTIIALPDTQHYSEAFPDIYTAQTQWIVDNQAARNIVFVTHLGDIVEHNNLESEWLAADFSMSILDDHVPYGMGPGNHDQPTTLYNQYFPYTRYQGKPWYGGHHSDKNDNNYQLFSAAGTEFLIIHLEFCPPSAAVSWADSVLKTYPNRTAIIATHGYLGESAQRSVSGCSNTQYLWDGLALPNPNVHFMLSGHVHNEARRTDTANGHPVFQMLSDYQDRPSGGEGWLRILRFVPGENKVYVQTYSPWLNRYETDADSEFTLDFPMGGAFSMLGTVTAPSGSTASLAPVNLSSSTQYEWNATVTNSSGKSRTGPLWSFTTGSPSGANQPPLAASQSLSTSEDTPAAVVFSATDPDGNPLTYSVVSGPSHGSLSGAAPNVSYQPQANYNGLDSLTFRASDGLADSNVAAVSITVLAVNDPPAAANDAYGAQAGATLSVTAPGVLGNDSDIDNPTLTATMVSGPVHGSFTLNANGSFSYTPAAGYSGPDSFTYRASDGLDPSSVATATLTVNPLPSVSSVTVNPASVTGGANLTGTVTLNAAAPAAGAVVTLASGNPAVASVPGSVTVAANSSTATFPVNTQAVAGVTPVTITATFNGSATATLTVNPPPSFNPIRVNAGGASFTDSQGRVWSADSAFSGGNAASVSGRAIASTVDDTLYQSERWGASTYTFTVPAGSYQVTLKFVETYFTSGAASGQRLFDVAVNGATVLTNFDIKATAGGANIAVDLTFGVNAGAGNNNLQIQFIHVAGQPDDPKVDAIEIVGSGG